MEHLLIIEDDKVDQMAFERYVRTSEFPYTYQLVSSIAQAKEVLQNTNFDCIVSDFSLGDGTAFEILALENNAPLVVVTGTGSEEVAVEALKNGAYDYLIKDVEGHYLKMLPITVQNARQRFLSGKELQKYQANLEQLVESRTLALKSEIEVRKTAEIELIKLSKAVEQSPVIIVITDLLGNIEYVNTKFVESTGYSIEEVIGKRVNILKSGEQADAFYKILWETISSGKVWRGEFCNKKKKGELFWESATVSPIIDNQGKNTNYLKVSEDITIRKQTEVELRQSEDRFKRLFEGLGDAVYVTRVSGANRGDILEANPASVLQTGYTRNELLQMNILRDLCIAGSSDVSENDCNEKLHNGESLTTTEKKRRKDGSEYWTEVIISPFEYKGEQVSLSINHDITERKIAEEELKAALSKAEESDRLKSAFLTNMSHEIRTPMNGILGFSSLLKEPGLSGENLQAYIRIIEKSGSRMLNTINNLMDIAKIESGQVEVSISDTDVNDLLEYIYSFFKPEAKQKGIQLILSKKLTAKESIINTDREKLYSILTNLVKNAIKYTHEGSISIGCSVKGRELQFFVKDSGIGIPKKRQQAIFERFVQADIEDRAAYEGTGLGLSISKAYVEMLGGRIWVESDEGNQSADKAGGSVFYFKIPSKPIPNEKKVRKKVILSNGVVNKIENLNILIAEDDEVSKMFISIIVEKYSQEIIKVKSGQEAVDACRQRPDTDLILMDIKMPGMGGIEAAKQIRKFNKEVVIIAQTAFGLIGDREKAIEAGCNDYITKPVDKDELMTMIEWFFR